MQIDKFRNHTISIPSDGKYEIGVQSHKVKDVANFKPKFAFDYISDRGGTFCFNSSNLGLNHYKDLIFGLKEASKHTYKDLEKSHTFHFHDIDFEDVSIRKSDFYKALINQYDGEDYIVPYQLKIKNKSRVIGFLYDATFYLVMYDCDHKAYGDKKQKSKRKKIK